MGGDSSVALQGGWCVCVCVLSPGRVVGQRARIVRVSEECSILLIGATDSRHMA